MNRLAEILGERDASRILWFAPDGHPISIGAMAAACASIDYANWRGRRVALGAMPAHDLARALVLLDGVAETILFLPLEQDSVVQRAYLDLLRIDVVLGADAVPPDSIFSANEHAISLDSNHVRSKAANETQWVLPTSGTTGTPKLIRHTLSTLTRSMSRRDVGMDYVWGSLYNPRRFAGLQVFLQSLFGGTPLILDDQYEISPAYLSRLARHGCNALSATPSMWRKLAMCPGFESMQLKQITLGGETADQPILDLLRRSFPTARVTHIYASTEAGVGFAVRDGLAGFPASYLDSPPGKVGMRIDTAGRLWFRPDGEVPEEIGAQDEVSDGWIDSGDLVKVTGERIHFLGRASGSINVGGNKVMPEEVEAVIMEVPGVAFAVVKGRKNALMGNLVEAHVAPSPGVLFDDKFKRAITELCRNRLDAYKVPAFVKPMDQIELNAVGKVSRRDAA